MGRALSGHFTLAVHFVEKKTESGAGDTKGRGTGSGTLRNLPFSLVSAITGATPSTKNSP